jgi:hypothetical protein
VSFVAKHTARGAESSMTECLRLFERIDRYSGGECGVELGALLEHEATGSAEDA